jgi:hypothetical protein
MAGESSLVIRFGADTAGLQSAVAVAKAQVASYSSELRKLSAEAVKSGGTANDNLTQSLRAAAAAASGSKRELEGLIKATQGHTQANLLNRAQQMELGHVARSVFDQMAAGQGIFSALSKESGRLGQVLTEGDKSVGGSLSMVGKIALSLVNPFTVTAAAIAATLVTLRSFASQATEVAEQAELLKSKFGLVGDSAAHFTALASRSGADVNELGQAFVELSRRVSEASERNSIGANRIKNAISAVGLSLADLKTNDPSELFRRLQVSYDRTADSANKYAAFQILLGSSFEKLYPLMQRGSSAIDQIYGAADRAGTAIKGPLKESLDGTLEATRKLGDAFLELKEAALGAFLRKFDEFKPAIDGAVVGLTQLVNWLAQMRESASGSSKDISLVKIALEGVADAMKLVVTTLAAGAAAFQSLWETANATLNAIKVGFEGVIAVAKDAWHWISGQGADITPREGTIKKLSDETDKWASNVQKVWENFNKVYNTTWGKGVPGAPESDAGKKEVAAPWGTKTAAAAKEAKSEIQTYIAELQKAEETAKAELATWGLGNVERAKAVALVKAQAAAKKEGRELTDEETKKVQNLAAAEEKAKDQLKELKTTQKEINAVFQDFANVTATALDNLLIKGQKLKQIFQELIRSLASSALKSIVSGALTGQGLLGGIIGNKATEGGLGGIFGALTGAAGGTAGLATAATTLTASGTALTAAAAALSASAAALSAGGAAAGAGGAGGLFSSLGGLAALLPAFDVGSWGLPGMGNADGKGGFPAIVHPGEMIIPSGPASAIRNGQAGLGAGAGGGSSGGDVHLHVHAADAQSVAGLFKNNGRTLAQVLKSVLDANPSLRPAH